MIESSVLITFLMLQYIGSFLEPSLAKAKLDAAGSGSGKVRSPKAAESESTTNSSSNPVPEPSYRDQLARKV